MSSNPTPTHHRTQRRRRSGFSLIELMVVIVIIAILAGGAVFIFRGATDDARVTVAVSDIKQMADNIAMYQTKKGSYPKSFEEVEGLLKVVFPRKDPWGNEYEFQPGDDGFTIISKGKNPADESDDVWYSSTRGRIIKPGDTVE